MIVIVNYGLGNLGSIQNMLKRIGAKNIVISNENEIIDKAEKIILPGVGAFNNGMSKIRESNLLEVLNENVLIKKKPVLGICLGMQLLTKHSEEGDVDGLGWIDAYTRKFNFSDENKGLKSPHMGWNEVCISKSHSLIENLDNNSRFYFVHSYHVVCNNPQDELLKCNYGIDFTCALQFENIMGVQFHPEKSHKFGMNLLRNFYSM